MKYIVFITTNIVNKKIYVGLHYTDKPYTFDGYLGNGININDRATYRYCHSPLEAEVNMYGPGKFTRHTLYVCDNLLDALEKEKGIVTLDFVKRKDVYNTVIGGDGIVAKHDRTVYQYDLQGNFIKAWPSITEASIHHKCSSALIGRSIYDRMPHLKSYWTSYKYDKIDLNNYQLKNDKTKCYLYDDNGNLIKEYNSIIDCANDIGDEVENVNKAIRGKNLVLKCYYVSDILYKTFPVRKEDKHDKVYEYDLEGNFVREWGYPKEINDYYHKSVRVSAAIRLGTICEGSQWSWIKVPSMKELNTPKTSVRVAKYDLEGNLVTVFENISSAIKDTPTALAALIGKTHTAGNHIWKYVFD
jgi:hypothetical protein